MTAARFALVNASMARDSQLVRDQCLLVTDGVIDHVGQDRGVPDGYSILDVAGRYVLPGLLDLHVHGALGHTFNEADEAAWRVVLDAQLRAGTTGLLATLVSDSPEAMAAALATRSRLSSQSSLLGCHLEGPYLSPLFNGAHPPEVLREPSDASWHKLIRTGGVKMITLAPELPGAVEAIQAMALADVVVSAGHSAATPEVMELAAAAGLRHVAHLWSGHSSLTKEGPWRRPGLLEHTLASTNLTAEIIADGCHLPASMVRIAYRCLGSKRLCLVSDASAGTGLPVDTQFQMGAARGVVAQGVALSIDGRTFCGSTSFLADTLRFAVLEAGIPLADAIEMATLTPANVIGVADRVGVLAPGRVADLLVLDHDLATWQVFQAGRQVPGAGLASRRSL